MSRDLSTSDQDLSMHAQSLQTSGIPMLLSIVILGLLLLFLVSESGDTELSH